MNSKKFNLYTICGLLLILTILAASVYITDPFFHYHKPYAEFPYFWINERYQNNGITRNFDYNAIITGTSMTECFKVSQMNEKFNVNAVKVSYSGAALNEIRENLMIGLKTHPDVVMVLQSVDYTQLIVEKDVAFDEKAHNFKYPYYLLDNNIFNDVKYVWNKAVLSDSWKIINHKINAQVPIASFDEYGNWSKWFVFGKQAVLETYTRPEASNNIILLSENEKNMIKENIQTNIVNLCEKYPQVSFYIFIPPYSVCWWDCNKRAGKVEYWIEAEKIAIEEILKCENIKLFSFSNDISITGNLDNYKDQAHYGEWINEEILTRIVNKKNQIKKDNYLDYLNELKELYLNYDYEQIYQ